MRVVEAVTFLLGVILRFRPWNLPLVLLAAALALGPAPVCANPPARFVQVEQEGNLGSVPEDARGNFFAWYAPVEYDDALVDQVVTEISRWKRLTFRAWRRVWPSKEKFDDLSLAGKVRYLELLAEKRGACQRGVPCPLVERKESAPLWLSIHPYFEGAPGCKPSDPPSFWFPEITTDQDHPAMTHHEALERHRLVIANTGLDAPHFHVFLRIPREQLLERREALFAYLQRANDDLFLAGVRRALADAMHNNLRPWTEPVQQKLDSIIQAGSADPYRLDRLDEFDPKRMNLALRYWGENDGVVLISLELRGLRSEYLYPPASRSVVRMEGMEPPPRKSRSFAVLAGWLGRIWDAGGDLLTGSLAPRPHVVRRPNLVRMEAAIAQVAQQKGVTRYFSYADFLAKLYDLAKPTAGLLMPFSDNQRGLEYAPLRQFVEKFVELSAEMKQGFYGYEYHHNQFADAFDSWAESEQRFLGALPWPGIAPGSQCGAGLNAEGRTGS